MDNQIEIKPLSENTQDIPVLSDHFLQAWPEHYGQCGPGDAQADIESYANIGVLPIGLVAYHLNIPCGLMALKADSISTRPDLGPWVAAGFVAEDLRDHGIGSSLLSAIEKLAVNMQFKTLYAGTARAHGLLLRAGWNRKESLVYGGEDVSIYRKHI